MANDRYRDDDDGYIARRGFGNERAGYDRSREASYERTPRRDYGDSAGYGSGGSTRDWHDVVGEDRDYDSSSIFRSGSNRDWASPRSGGSYGRDREGYVSDTFGRGSRDYDEDRSFLDRAGDEVRSWFADDNAERRRDRDTRQAGQYRGRGPKGYQRSDARILEDVNDRLTEDPHVDASEIEVSVSNREVTLSGIVNSRFEKRHAEDLAESVSGVTHVQNNLRVQQAAEMGMGGSMLSGAGAAGAGTVGRAEASTASTGGTRGGKRGA
ncbi:BON domain-containing protein [Microvirga makkahensis]|uniref:BON domain-containing protein n=1 Tax=Microvirga makkahensis TaxID=1128670 RepID=A0A7X3MNI4_9HYPH|nr:BON domain-containing protein [Microvirga makkahensis]MXQ10347.1 BON domain-containing protein [Microvirga makkahensis]